MDEVAGRRKWKGVDAGNEWAIEYENFLAMLQLINDYSPADYRRVDSQFSIATNKKFKRRVIYTRGDNTTSGILRRGDPWRRLNLVNVKDNRLVLTPLGQQYLTDPSSRLELLIPTLASYAAKKENNPFLVITAATLESSSQFLKIRDIVTKVVPYYSPGTTSLKHVLDADAPPNLEKRSARNIKSYLKMLQLIGIGKIDRDALQIKDKGAARDLLSSVGVTIQPSNGCGYSRDNNSAEVTSRQCAEIDLSKNRLKLEGFSWNSHEVSPEIRREKLEKATRAHEDALETAAGCLQESGYKCYENKASFDLFSTKNSDSWLLEVKTITTANINTQLRTALGQLLTYKFTWQQTKEHNPGINSRTQLAIIVDQDPRAMMERWWPELLDSLRIKLWWTHEGRLYQIDSGHSPSAQV